MIFHRKGQNESFFLSPFLISNNDSFENSDFFSSTRHQSKETILLVELLLD